MRGIPRYHPLRKLFLSLIHRDLPRAGVHDAAVLGYVSDLMVRVSHMDNLFRIKTAQGKRIYTLGEMLAEAEKRTGKGDIYSATGDCTLFLSGLFPEALPRFWNLPVEEAVRVGKRVYYTASLLKEESIFRKLSHLFEYCVLGLSYVREDLSWLPVYEEMKRLLEGEGYQPKIIS